jgi:hypothetical protein
MGIRTYKEWPCATGDSATYFVAAEVVAVNPPCLLSEKTDKQDTVRDILRCLTTLR